MQLSNGTVYLGGFKISKKTMYAMLYRDNWDGEGDVYYILAYKNESGEWFHYDTNKKLMEYKGDEIIKKWRLK